VLPSKKTPQNPSLGRYRQTGKAATKKSDAACRTFQDEKNP